MKRDKSDLPGKSPGFWFYPSDFERDLQMLTLGAQGLWIRMMGWMHQNEARRGFLELPTGEPMTESDIAARAGKLPREVSGYLRELERIGVFSRDDRQCIFSRRMARETHISAVRSTAAKTRADAADRSFAGKFAPAKTPISGEQNVSKKPTVPDSVSDSVSDSSVTVQKPPQPTADADLEQRLVNVAHLLTQFMGATPDDGILLRVEQGLRGASDEDLRDYLLTLDRRKFADKTWPYLARVIEGNFGSLARRVDAANRCA